MLSTCLHRARGARSRRGTDRSACRGELRGTVYELDLNAVQARDRYDSMHEMGLCEVFRTLPEDGRPELVILGMEPGVIDYGLELSPEVQAELKRLGYL